MALANRNASRAAPPRRGRPRSCVWWFLFGALLGGFGVGFRWMSVAPPEVPPKTASAPKAERPAPPQPTFDFPNILKDTEVDIREDKKPLPPPAPRPEPPRPVVDEPVEPVTAPPARPRAETAAPAPAGTYVLQVASFKSASDAEHMKAQLAMIGVSTRIQSVTLKDGAVWHRVVTGPLNGKKALDEAQATLKRHGNNAMPVKVK